MSGVNRFPARIVDGAHHGSDGWAPTTRRRGNRPRFSVNGRPAHTVDKRTLIDFEDEKGEKGEKVLTRACEIVRKHFVVHPADAEDPDMRAYGSLQGEVSGRDDRGRPTDWETTGSVQACMHELEGL
jgi:hypothetical protein